MSITIYGASDDLIEVEGDIYEEFTLRDDDEGDLCATSNGCIFRILYDRDGCWRISPVVVAEGIVWSLEQCAVGGDDYSDRLTVEGVEWIVHGSGYALHRGRA